LDRLRRRGGRDRDDRGDRRDPQPPVLYDVTLSHPVTRAVLDSRVVPQNEIAVARAELGTPHWRVWKYAGVNEPTNFRRFDSAAEAQSFEIPVKLFGLIPFAVESQSVQAGQVRVSRVGGRRRPIR
jgi:hypothetical protein